MFMSRKRMHDEIIIWRLIIELLKCWKSSSIWEQY
jgi:hypothetical protein